jgi:rod shape-determining protein MreD
MKQFLLLLLNGLAIVLLQVIPWETLLPQPVTVNLSLVFVIFLALYRPSINSWFLAFLLGFALDALSGGPAGLFTLINLAIFLLIRAAEKVVLFESTASRTVLVFALCVSVDLAFLSIARIVTANTFGLVLKSVLVSSIFAAVLSLPLFAFYRKVYALPLGGN